MMAGYGSSGNPHHGKTWILNDSLYQSSAGPNPPLKQGTEKDWVGKHLSEQLKQVLPHDR
ncbi:hypothetical protein STEG23_021912, partial [Scotinomys teguina]